MNAQNKETKGMGTKVEWLVVEPRSSEEEMVHTSTTLRMTTMFKNQELLPYK
jgi:hypothetical protein